MNNRLLALDEEKVREARRLARSIALDVQKDIERHTTVSVERTVARLYGIDGVDHEGVPLANVVVDQVNGAGLLDRGISYWIANAAAALGQTPQQVAEECARGLRLCELEPQDPGRVAQVVEEYTNRALTAIARQREKREALQARLGLGQEPLKYVIVASGNISKMWSRQIAADRGGDIIAVIRTTAQSLLDYGLTALPLKALAAPTLPRRISSYAPGIG